MSFWYVWGKIGSKKEHASIHSADFGPFPEVRSQKGTESGLQDGEKSCLLRVSSDRYKIRIHLILKERVAGWGLKMISVRYDSPET